MIWTAINEIKGKQRERRKERKTECKSMTNMHINIFYYFKSNYYKIISQQPPVTSSARAERERKKKEIKSKFIWEKHKSEIYIIVQANKKHSKINIHTYIRTYTFVYTYIDVYACMYLSLFAWKQAE